MCTDGTRSLQCVLAADGARLRERRDGRTGVRGVMGGRGKEARWLHLSKHVRGFGQTMIVPSQSGFSACAVKAHTPL